MNKQILFVDDELPVLESYQRILHKDFQFSVALSGEAGLADIKKNGSYAVVVSDMRMPGMNGVQFLSHVREISPQTVRVVLTGYADIESAMGAVNEDAVFRFLTKPCPPVILKRTLTACLLQHHLVAAEKELLEDTLMGSIKVLTDVLSLANPAAFGRSLRINTYVQHMVRELHLDQPWRYEAAAVLSQLGCITLEPELLEAAYRGAKLSDQAQAHFRLHPAVAQNLLSSIPRLEGIAWIIGQQIADSDADPHPDPVVSESLRIGAAMLRVAIAFDELKVQGCSDLQAIAEMQASRRYESRIVAALESLKPGAPAINSRMVRIADLEPGMIANEELRSNAGLLLAANGQELSYPLVVRLQNFHRSREIKDALRVLVSSSAAAGA
jgi:FixJ family two-component response regulator